MLKKLRNKKTAKRVWIILAILILPAFLLWGLGGVVRSQRQSNYVGKIFGKKISISEYKDALEAVKNQAIIQFGDKYFEIQKSLGLESQAWERLILLAEAKKRKIKVSDKEIIDLIKSYPFFKTSKGQFDNRLYSQMLQYAFQTQARIFEEQIRQNLMVYKLYQRVTDSINLTDKEIKDEYRKLNEEVSLYYIASIPSDFLKDITVSDEELKDYFAKNSLQFKQPLSFNIEYISLTAEDKDEEAIKDKVKKLSLRLNKKEALAKVAKDFDLAVKETGLFTENDPIPGIGWSPQILSLISKTKIGNYLPPIHMDKSYYILRLKERKEPYIPDFELIKDKVKEALPKGKSQKIAKEKIEDCLKKLNELYKAEPKGVNFDNIAKQYGLKSWSTNLFKYGSYIEGIGASDSFWTAVDKLKEDEFSEVISVPSGFYIIKLKSRIPIDEQKFQAAKAEFVQEMLLRKKQEYFVKFVEELKRKTQSNFQN